MSGLPIVKENLKVSDGRRSGNFSVGELWAFRLRLPCAVSV